MTGYQSGWDNQEVITTALKATLAVHLGELFAIFSKSPAELVIQHKVVMLMAGLAMAPIFLRLYTSSRPDLFPIRRMVGHTLDAFCMTSGYISLCVYLSCYSIPAAVAMAATSLATFTVFAVWVQSRSRYYAKRKELVGSGQSLSH